MACLHQVSSISQLRNRLVHVSGIIIITDGVTSVPDVAVCETLLNQLRSGTIACSFVQVNNKLHYSFFPKMYVQNVHGTVPLMVSCVYAALYANCSYWIRDIRREENIMQNDSLFFYMQRIVAVSHLVFCDSWIAVL